MYLYNRHETIFIQRASAGVKTDEQDKRSDQSKQYWTNEQAWLMLYKGVICKLHNKNILRWKSAKHKP